MHLPSAITVENKPYPTMIMGEDFFTGWFRKDDFESETQRAAAYLETIQAAYTQGVRGFSISPHTTLLSVLKQFKQTTPDIRCIANPHFNSHYYLGEELLWTPHWKNRLDATVKCVLPKELTKEYQYAGFAELDTDLALTNQEISEIRLDADEYSNQLSQFSSFCDFALVGNLGKSVLQILGRNDIVKTEIQLVRKAGMTPIGIAEGGGVALELMRELELHAFWLRYNPMSTFPSIEYTNNVLTDFDKPITAYKIFQDPTDFNIERSVDRIIKLPIIRSVVAGVDSPEQAVETFTALKRVL